MNPHQEINAVIEQAKQQRAEYMASFARSHPLPLALVAAFALLLLQFGTVPVSNDGDHARATPLVSQLG